MSPTDFLRHLNLGAGGKERYMVKVDAQGNVHRICAVFMWHYDIIVNLVIQLNFISIYRLFPIYIGMEWALLNGGKLNQHMI